jgi:hypothetical protein
MVSRWPRRVTDGQQISIGIQADYVPSFFTTIIKAIIKNIERRHVIKHGARLIERDTLMMSGIDGGFHIIP